MLRIPQSRLRRAGSRPTSVSCKKPGLLCRGAACCSRKRRIPAVPCSVRKPPFPLWGPPIQVGNKFPPGRDHRSLPTRAARCPPDILLNASCPALATNNEVRFVGAASRKICAIGILMRSFGSGFACAQDDTEIITPRTLIKKNTVS